jgi:hypothetical protein
MKSTRIALLFLALLTPVAAFAEVTADAAAADAAGEKSLSIRTFQFRHKQPEKALPLIKPLLSADGSIALQSNALVVTDKGENMKAIAAALADFDAPPQPFRLEVRLVAASRVATAPKVADELKEIAPKLALLQYNAFEVLGSATVEAKEGDPGLIDMPTGYRADFRLGEYDPASDTVRVEDFRIARVQGENRDQLTQLLKTTLNLKIGQMFIMGATRPSQTQRALMVVVTARR